MDKEKIAADKAKGIEFSDGGKKLVKYPEELTEESYAIPEGVKTIGKGAFNSAQNLLRVTFPQSLKTIENEAFMWCAVQEVALPEGVEEIGAAAFWCAGLKEISIPRSVRWIGEYAFYNCRNLKKIVTFWDEPHGDVMALREWRGDSDSWKDGEAPASLFGNPRVFHGCKKLRDVTGCNAVKKLIAERLVRLSDPVHPHSQNQALILT